MKEPKNLVPTIRGVSRTDCFKLRDFFLAMVKQDTGLGCQDARALLHLLKPSFERFGRRRIFMDVGANNGNMSAAIMKTFEPWSVGIPS